MKQVNNVDKGKNMMFHYSKFEKKFFPFIYIIIAFPFLQFCVFWIGVNVSSFAYAFEAPRGGFTWDNFKDVFYAFSNVGHYNVNLGDAIGRSMLLWTTSTFIAFPISIITTYILFRRIWGHYVFRICYIIPGLMGAILWVSLIRYISQYNGPLVELLSSLNIDLPDEVLRDGLFACEQTAFPTLVTINVLMGMVGNNVVLTGAYSRVPDELYESAELDGAGFWTVCFKIVIPCVWSTISMLLIFSLCSVFTADYHVYLFTDGTGAPEMSTIGFTLYKINYEISVNGGKLSAYGYPAAIGMVLTLMTLPIVIFGRKLLEKLGDNVEV